MAFSRQVMKSPFEDADEKTSLKPKKVWALDFSRMGLPRYEFFSTGELTLGS
jgi:hypothetical protein